MKYTLLAILAGFAVACGGAYDPSIGSSMDNLNGDEPTKIHYQKGQGGGTSSSNLIDHGGPVLSSSQTYAIWWGNASAFPSDAQTGLNAMFAGFNGSNFLGIAGQYMRGAGVSTGFTANLTDSSAPPSRSPRVSAIVGEACKAITAAGLSPDPTALYLVYTSNFPGGHVNFCAWHSDGTCNGTTIQVAYMPNTTGIAGCDPGNLYNCNNYSQGTRSLANVSSHEFMEAITDPQLNAWYDSGGAEIGDKCAWQFSSCANLKNGNWQLQEEWSNSNNGCVQN